ncbi:MAG: bifunctional folylpolyglutamate synthase/dihydrofolate synthase [Candidatus Aminicenantes bacterium]|nr:bifunctional folylpolyglutamate synthase/dihydrofolate synthase [Candidatus Aminicenantes bacterium]
MMNYAQTLQYLQEVQERGSKLSLDNIQKIIDHLPFDLSSMRFIQVAGTNGKGSTAHFLTSILQSAGSKVGLFTSPHLQDIRERITINKAWISKKNFAACLFQVKQISEDLLQKGLIENMPTFFEYIFLTAVTYFFRNKAGYVVLEVGLGGRLDATSTLTPAVSVITNISYDHTKTLGKRISDIAVEKAGIIKKRVPIICGCSVYSAANRVIREIAQKRNAPFYNVLNAKNKLDTQKYNGFYRCVYVTESGRYEFDVHLNGRHQTANAATAIRAVEVLNKTTTGANITPTAIREGIAKSFVPGRIEIFKSSPQVILDGGHNVESIKALRNYLEQERKKNLTLVFGVLRDKKYRKMASLLLPFAKNVIITEPVSKRALPAENLVKFFIKENNHSNFNLNIEIKKKPGDAFHAASRFREDILITGSLYLAGEMRNIIKGG